MINIKCIGHQVAYELDNIKRLFEPYMAKDYEIESIYDKEKVYTLIYDDTQIVCKNEQVVTLTGETLSDKRNIKNTLKKSLYEALVSITRVSMPWGTLTGIRPTKLVHDYQKEGLSNKEIIRKLEEEYLVSEEKIKLMLAVAEKEKHILEKNKDNEVSLYIGIPFCPTRCVYCSFTSYSLENKDHMVEAYLEALCKEIDYVAKEKAGLPIRSIYIGGGTPTSIKEKQLERLLRHIQLRFDTKNVEEYTLEAGRPDTITKEKLIIAKEFGVTRISINPQSMNQKTLEAIGRRHTAEDVIEAFHKTREVGFNVINMDMILGLPGEELHDVENTLDELAKLDPENITVHTLAIKRASILNENKGSYQITDDAKTIEKMITLCEEKTKKMGLEPYYLYRQKNMLGNFENVGYAKKDKENIYNIQIMEEKQTILALGAGAITKIVYDNNQKIDRVPNVKSLEHYIDRIDEMIERKKEGFRKFI